MQINPFGFPLGAGMQSAPATGGTGLGFADALGFALDPAGQLRTGLIASATPPAHLTPKLTQTLLAQAQLAGQAQPTPATGLLSGLQQPTSMSELMATAAKLPAAETMPVAAAAAPLVAQPVDIAPDAAMPEAAVPAVASETATPEAAVPVPVETKPDAAKPALPLSANPAPGEVAPEPEGDVPPQTPVAATPAESTPSKPQKGPRGRSAAAEADAVPVTDTKPAVPADLVALATVAQSAAVQQPAPREASANAPGGSAVTKPGKAGTHAAAPAPAAAQPAPGTGSTEFGNAVAARTEFGGSEANPDGQPEPETMPATSVKADGGAPSALHQAHNPAAIDTARAAAPAAAPAEPVIEARANHLGHSLGVEIARKVELGEETLRIRLNPIELGRVEVTLAFDDKGSLQATVRTESAQAMDLLRQDAPDLARTLDQAGVRTDAQSFRFENRGGDSGGQQAQQQNQQSSRGQFAASDDDALVAEPIYRPVRSDGQVDLLA